MGAEGGRGQWARRDSPRRRWRAHLCEKVLRFLQPVGEGEGEDRIARPATEDARPHPEVVALRRLEGRAAAGPHVDAAAACRVVRVHDRLAKVGRGWRKRALHARAAPVAHGVRHWAHVVADPHRRLVVVQHRGLVDHVALVIEEAAERSVGEVHLQPVLVRAHVRAPLLRGRDGAAEARAGRRSKVPEVCLGDQAHAQHVLEFWVAVAWGPAMLVARVSNPLRLFRLFSR